MSQNDFDTLDGSQTIPGGPEGRLLANRYRILRKLGEGGMGMVYLAEDGELNNTKVAIKFIPPVLAGNARALKNLRREAQVAMQLSHPNIIRLHDLHTDGHQKFLVMEYIEGRTLEDLLTERENDRMTPEELLPVAAQIAAGLDYAHSRGVLHRDLKPSNIMVGHGGEVKLLDFGIAREMKDSFTRVTGQETSGTLPYMSPQQLMGEAPTAGMDIYSFAAVLYECLAGCTPFHAGDIRHQILSKSPPQIAHVSGQINAALRSALAKDANERPAAAQELVESLGQDRRPGPHPQAKTARKPPEPSDTSSRNVRRRKRFWAAVALAGCVAVGTFIFGVASEDLAGPLNTLGIVPAATIAIGIISRRPVVSLICGILVQIVCLVGYFVGGGYIAEEEWLIIIPAVLGTGALGAAGAALARRRAEKTNRQQATGEESVDRQTSAEQEV